MTESLNKKFIVSDYFSTFNGLCFTANSAGSTVKLNKYGYPSWSGEYSINGTSWNQYVPGTTGAITLNNIGDQVYFRGNITSNFGDSRYLYFVMTGNISASGNCNSMYNSTNFEDLTQLSYKYCYYKLFSNCTSLITPPELPATGLSSYCYCNMFYGCTSLIAVPQLPAISLPTWCYDYMFQNCTSLYMSSTYIAEAPYVYKIPRDRASIGSIIYYDVFAGCKGTRTTESPYSGSQWVYYTQNPPIGSNSTMELSIDPIGTWLIDEIIYTNNDELIYGTFTCLTYPNKIFERIEITRKDDCTAIGYYYYDQDKWVGINEIYLKYDNKTKSGWSSIDDRTITIIEMDNLNTAKIKSFATKIKE